MMTIEEQFGIFSNLTYKAMELKQTAGHEVFVEYAPHVEWLSIRIYNGPFEWSKIAREFRIEMKYPDMARKAYKEALNYLNGMEAQNG